jgi:hypothetical protein
VNIYAPDVPASRRRDIALKARMTARMEVSQMRKLLRELFQDEDEDHDDDDDDGGPG